MLVLLANTGKASLYIILISLVQIPLIERADNEDVQIARLIICRLFGVGKNGTTVTYKQPDEDESTLASVWSDHPHS